MQVIHRLSSAYPFFLQYQPQHTYLEVLKENLTQEQIALERSKFRILKQMYQPCLIRLDRIYREDTTLHLLYQYYPISLEKYVEERSQNAKHSKRHQALQLHQQFTTTIDTIIQSFVQAQVKADICIFSIAVSSYQQGQIKVLVDPFAEFHTLTDQNHSYGDNDEEDEDERYKIFLRDYYNAEKKRLIIEFQEWIQKYFGKHYLQNDHNHPNFVINGSKLIFLHEGSNEHQHKHHLMSNSHHEKSKVNRLGNSPNKAEEFKRQLKQKNCKKIQEIKSVLNRLEHKTPSFNSLMQPKLTPHHHSNQYSQLTHLNQLRHHSSANERLNSQVPHLNRKEKTDGIIFKPEEITVEKTPRLGENQYLQSLQNELQKIGQMKQSKESKLNKLKRLSSLRDAQQNTIKINTSNHDDKSLTEHSRQVDIKILPTASRTEAFSSYVESEPIKQQQRKEEKHNKYKMKITTSHEFEIEGAGEPKIKEIERDIVEGIKSGRISLSQFQDIPNHFEIETTQIQDIEPINRQETQLSTATSDIVHKNHNASENYNHIEGHLSSSSAQLAQSRKEIDHDSKRHFQGNQQNITDKVREAKQRSEQLLKEYKKRH